MFTDQLGYRVSPVGAFSYGPLIRGDAFRIFQQRVPRVFVTLDPRSWQSCVPTGANQEWLNKTSSGSGRRLHPQSASLTLCLFGHQLDTACERYPLKRRGAKTPEKMPLLRLSDRLAMKAEYCIIPRLERRFSTAFSRVWVSVRFAAPPTTLILPPTYLPRVTVQLTSSNLQDSCLSRRHRPMFVTQNGCMTQPLVARR
jgi:hypothetical protein